MEAVGNNSVAMSAPEAAAAVGVSVSSIYALFHRGELPGARRLGKRIVIHRGVFEEWLRSGMGKDPESPNRAE